jgi:hypothetical protein
MVLPLKNKTNNFYIWCYADQFVHRHGLTGFCNGMFISEVGEVLFYGFNRIDLRLIDYSNDRFASIVSKHINEPMEVLYHNIINEYEFIKKFLLL